MIKRLVLLLLVAAGLSSCLGDPVESAVTQLNKEQEKIMVEYAAKLNIPFEKEALYSVRGDYFGILSHVEAPGTGLGTYNKNESIWLKYTIKDIQGNMIDSKTESDSVLIYPDGFANKILGLSWCAGHLLGNGGKGSFLIPSTIGYGGTPPAGIEPNAILLLDIEVLDRFNETGQMSWFIERNNIEGIEATGSGLLFAKTHTTADTTTISENSMVTVKYKGQYPSGFVFDQNTTGASFSVNEVVTGFGEALKKMRVGEKAVAIFPSELGYGQGIPSRNIPGNMPLIFDIEIVSVL